MPPPLAVERAAEVVLATIPLPEDSLSGVDMPPPPAEARATGAAVVLLQMMFFGITSPDGAFFGSMQPDGLFFDGEPAEPVEPTEPIGLRCSLAAALAVVVPALSPPAGRRETGRPWAQGFTLRLQTPSVLLVWLVSRPSYPQRLVFSLFQRARLSLLPRLPACCFCATRQKKPPLRRRRRCHSGVRDA